MSANLSGLKKVKRFYLLRDVEVPLTKNVISEAMDWLISLDWVDIID
jgi:hypothetical protein